MRDGMCIACHEYTSVPGSCCGAPVASQGSFYSEESFCDCDDCINDPENACEFNCVGTDVCQACREAREARIEQEFDERVALGCV